MPYPIKFLKQPTRYDRRTPEHIREHYRIELEIANRLRCSTRQERMTLYRDCYDELFARVPHHPQIAQKASPDQARADIDRQASLLRRFLGPDTTFLEIGCGDCRLSLEVCKSAALVYAADVCEFITRNHAVPANFKLLIFDGIHLPVPACSVDLAYSNQVLEHLHPEDLAVHLESIFRSLKANGRFVCVTPSRIGGPWDISFYFDRTCRGLHLREYTYHDLAPILRVIGFRKIAAIVGGSGRYWSFPHRPILWIENILGVMPWYLRSRLARTAPLRAFLGIRIAAIK